MKRPEWRAEKAGVYWRNAALTFETGSVPLASAVAVLQIACTSAAAKGLYSASSHTRSDGVS